MNLFGKWKEQATQYVDVRIQLAKLKFIGRTAHVLSNLMLGFVLLIVSVALLLFLGLGIMETLMDVLDSRAGGAFATAGIFLLLIGILFGLRRMILTSIANVFVRIMTDNSDEDDEEDEMHKNEDPGQR